MESPKVQKVSHWLSKFIIKNPINIDDLGAPHDFWKHPYIRITTKKNKPPRTKNKEIRSSLVANSSPILVVQNAPSVHHPVKCEEKKSPYHL